MARSPALSERFNEQGLGYRLDVWCDPVEERAVLRRELAAAPDDAGRAALVLYELGRIALAEGREVEAAQHLLRAYAQRPQFRPTLRLARHIYHRRGEPALLIRLLDAEARASRDHLTRAHLYRQQARLLWSSLGDVDAARVKLGASVQLDPSELASSRLLELLCAISEDPDERARLVERQLELVTDERVKAGMLVDLALLRFPLEPARSIELLQHDAAVEAAKPSLSLVLEQLLEEHGDTAQLALVLEAQGDEERADLLWKGSVLARAARLARDRGDLERAVVLFQRSADVDPYPDTLMDCFSLLVANGRIAQAVEVGEQLFDLLDTPRLRAALACELGDYSRLQLGDAAAASDWYHRCLLLAPCYQPALEGLSGILEGAGNLDGQLRIHQRDLASTHDPSARSHRLFRIASLLERHGRADEALEMHREALAARPSFLPSVLALERLLTRAERWVDLVRLYEQEIAHEEDAERAAHLLETMAEIWLHRLNKVDEAIDCYRRVTQRLPTHLRAIEAGARLCDEAQRWKDLIEFQEKGIVLTTDGQRKAELLERSGNVWEYRLLELDRAIECYQRALECSPEFLPALRALGRLFRQKGRWRDLIAMHRTELHVCAEKEHAIALLCTIAEVYEEELLDEEAAAQAYEEILARWPGYLHAIDALARLYERRGQWAQLIRLREATVDLLRDRSAQAVELCQIALLRARKQHDVEGAIRDLTRALRLAGDLVPAQAALEQALIASDSSDRLAEVLAAQLDRTHDAEARASLARRLAELLERAGAPAEKVAALYEQSSGAEEDPWIDAALARLYRQMNDPERQCLALEKVARALRDERIAGELELYLGQVKDLGGLGDPIPHYRRALERGAGRMHALRGLERHGRSAEDPTLLPEVVLARIELTTDDTERACLHTELARFYQASGDADAAEQAYRRALACSGAHASALWGLGRLLEERERWAESVDLAEREAAALEAPKSRAASLLRAARIAQDRLSDEGRALPLYRQVLRLQAGHADAYERLHDILSRRDDWSGLASLVRGQISATDDERAHAAMFAELGYIYLDRLKQARKGEACLRRVVSLDPENIAALTTLGDLYFARREWAKAEKVYSRAVNVAREPEVLAGMLRRLGSVYRKLARAAEALATFQLAANQSESWPEPWLLRQIAEVAGEVGDVAAQVNALDQLADITPDEAERVEARKRAAFIAEERLDDEQRAISALQQVLVLEPLDLEAIERLAALYGRSANRSALAQHIQAAVAQHRAALARSPLDPRLYEQLARIFRWRRQIDPYYCACLVLKQLGRLGEPELLFVEEHRRHIGDEPRDFLTPQLYEELVLARPINTSVRAFLRLAAPVLLKLLAEDPATSGLDRRARAGKHPLRAELERMAQAVGACVEFELWIGSDRIVAESRSFGNAALVVGAKLASAEASEAERFHLGRAVAALAEPVLLLPGVGAHELTILVHALLHALGTPWGAPLADVQRREIEDVATRIARLLPRKLRRQLSEGLPDDLGAFEASAAEALLGASRASANHAGLVLAGDLAQALAQARALPDGGSPAGAFADLGQYVLSESYFTLRARLGLNAGAVSAGTTNSEGQPAWTSRRSHHGL